MSRDVAAREPGRHRDTEAQTRGGRRGPVPAGKGALQGLRAASLIEKKGEDVLKGEIQSDFGVSGKAGVSG